MNLPVLVVENDIAVFKREQVEWKIRGIDRVRAGTMQDAIRQLFKDTYRMTMINGDNINYLPQLKIMRDKSPTPILIIATNPTSRDQADAIRRGADAFINFQDNTKDNIDLALALLRRHSERMERPRIIPIPVTCGNLTLYYDYHQAFCNDTEVSFTVMEYELLHCFFNNINITLSYGQLSQKVWKTDSASHNSIWQLILKLCTKLELYEFNGGSIKNIRGVGYRLSTRKNR